MEPLARSASGIVHGPDGLPLTILMTANVGLVDRRKLVQHALNNLMENRRDVCPLHGALGFDGRRQSSKLGGVGIESVHRRASQLKGSFTVAHDWEVGEGTKRSNLASTVSENRTVLLKLSKTVLATA